MAYGDGRSTSAAASGTCSTSPPGARSASPCTPPTRRRPSGEPWPCAESGSAFTRLESFCLTWCRSWLCSYARDGAALCAVRAHKGMKQTKPGQLRSLTAYPRWFGGPNERASVSRPVGLVERVLLGGGLAFSGMLVGFLCAGVALSLGLRDPGLSGVYLAGAFLGIVVVSRVAARAVPNAIRFSMSRRVLSGMAGLVAAAVVGRCLPILGFDPDAFSH
jgi:hypothetical protein